VALDKFHDLKELLDHIDVSNALTGNDRLRKLLLNDDEVLDDRHHNNLLNDDLNDSEKP
jgi:hypothetical protein